MGREPVRRHALASRDQIDAEVPRRAVPADGGPGRPGEGGRPGLHRRRGDVPRRERRALPSGPSSCRRTRPGSFSTRRRRRLRCSRPAHGRASRSSAWRMRSSPKASRSPVKPETEDQRLQKKVRRTSSRYAQEVRAMRALLATLAILALVAGGGGCGGSDNTSKKDAAPAPAPNPAPKPEAPRRGDRGRASTDGGSPSRAGLSGSPTAGRHGHANRSDPLTSRRGADPRRQGAGEPRRRRQARSGWRRWWETRSFASTPESGEVVGKPIRVGDRPLAVAVGEGSVWAFNSLAGTVNRIDPKSGKVLSESPRLVGRAGTPDFAGLAVANGSVWVSSPSEGTVIRLDAAKQPSGASRSAWSRALRPRRCGRSRLGSQLRRRHGDAPRRADRQGRRHDRRRRAADRRHGGRRRRRLGGERGRSSRGSTPSRTQSWASRSLLREVP